VAIEPRHLNQRFARCAEHGGAGPGRRKIGELFVRPKPDRGRENFGISHRLQSAFVKALRKQSALTGKEEIAGIAARGRDKRHVRKTR